MSAPVNGGFRTPTPEEEQQFFDDVRQAFIHLPRFIAQRLSRRVVSAYHVKGYSGARAMFAGIMQHDVPVLERTQKQYIINPDELPGYIFGGLASDDAYGVVRSLSWRFNVLMDGDEGDVRLLAQDISLYLLGEMEHLDALLAGEDSGAASGAFYAMAAGLVEHFRQEPPEWKRFTCRKLSLEQVMVAISRMMSERYWMGCLLPYVRRWREHLNIAVGEVRRQTSPHCSYERVQQWLAGRQRGREIMASTDVEDEDTGERFNLLDFVNNSVSDNEKRRAEMMTRVKGLENLAKFDGVAQEQGYTGLFFTITPPSEYHAWLMSGHRNRKYNGASPREAQQYFTGMWRRISSTLRRKGINIFGLRVSEPHHDGTPHWHGVLFVHEEHEKQLREILEDYANRAAHSGRAGGNACIRRPGYKSHLEIKRIDEDLGSATAYIAKHIGMNLDGCAPGGTNQETGHPMVVTARHACAWASLWGIKQFQFIGSAPVSVWRELRRFNNQAHADRISPQLGELHRAANGGDWQTYTRLQGGLFTTRDGLTLRAWYRLSDEPDECGRFSSAIRGVYLPGKSMPPVMTRTRSWKITRRNDVKPGSLKKHRKPALTPWTRVNNCIMSKKQPVVHPPDPYLKIPIQLELDFGEAKKLRVSER
ncbi:TPA: replication endonuclease [Escherichia coli]|nr:replication endonuclease [Escherichia coli]